MSEDIKTLVKKAMKNPEKVILKIVGKLVRGNAKRDELYLKLVYPYYVGKKLNLKNPKTFNEKLQWLKFNDRNLKYIKMVDKYEVRKHVAKVLGEQYLVPLLGVWDSFEEIDFEKLPDQFVLKCTHDSGGVVICTDKSKLNIEETKKTINRSLKRNFYHSGREWVYKDIKPRIICEKLIVDESSEGLNDYKFFCFDGEPKFMFVATNRSIDTRFDFYDLNFNHIPVKQHYENSERILKKPDNFEEMIELSKLLSKDIPHVRVDFYNVGGRIYFGELTFFHFSGLVKFEPEKYDKIFGDFINIEKFKNQ